MEPDPREVLSGETEVSVTASGILSLCDSLGASIKTRLVRDSGCGSLRVSSTQRCSIGQMQPQRWCESADGEE